MDEKLPKYILVSGPATQQQLRAMYNILHEEKGADVQFKDYMEPVHDAIISLCYNSEFIEHDTVDWNSEGWLARIPRGTGFSNRMLLILFADLTRQIGHGFLAEQCLHDIGGAEGMMSAPENAVWIITNVPFGPSVMYFPREESRVLVVGNEFDPTKFLENLKEIMVKA